ncbi:MAG: hypothetical protein JXA74_07455 [Anaerolineae bacterium]|nr:hypothetical protein [Anaerolineae bacterium]
MRKQRHARLLPQAFAQGGVIEAGGLTIEEISGILSRAVRSMTARVASVKEHHPVIVASNAYLRS